MPVHNSGVASALTRAEPISSWRADGGTRDEHSICPHMGGCSIADVRLCNRGAAGLASTGNSSANRAIGRYF